MTLTVWQWIGLALLVTIGVETFWIHYQTKELMAYKASIQIYGDAQKTNLATIADLRKANKAWADGSKEQIENGQAYTKAAVDYALQQQAKAKKSNATLQAIYDHVPEARVWASNAVDRNVAVQLRANAGS